ncbi:MAG: T9SS type A sorting domain-containing protein [Ignavibacteriales bacterium]|nr:T9SS type A sorting domain-containing protein [Ignavibacteriales bacterium]
MIKLKTLILLIILPFRLFSQIDSLISYENKTKEIKIVLQSYSSEDKNFDFTQRDYGTEEGFVFLPTDKPTNTYSGAGFIDYTPVQNFFSVNDYPIRTAVKLFRYENDSIKQTCSGIMITADLVLTACHCIQYYDKVANKYLFLDSLLAIPAYDNGRENPSFRSGTSQKYFFFKSALYHPLTKDIAIIKLREPIGIKTGWIGIAFSDDDNFFRNNLFHKLSYPGTVDVSDSTRVYYGDTLYYNYGTLDLIDGFYIGYNIFGIPGQSGSSLFYTDNNQYYSFGVLNWATKSRHMKINKDMFYAFKQLIENNIPNKEIPNNYYLSEAYPNPFNQSTKVNYVIPANSSVQISVYDILGRVVRSLVSEYQTKGNYEITFNANNLASGIYFIRMRSGDFISTKKIILMK